MDNLEKLKNTAKEVEKDSSTFMEPKIEKKKGAHGRPKMSDEEKAEAKRLRAEKQKQDAKTTQSKGPVSDTGSTATSPGYVIPSKQIIQPLAFGLSSLAVKYAGDGRASMTPDESEAFCEVGGKLLDKYAPGVFDKYGLEAVMLITLGMYGARVVALKKVLIYERNKKAESVKTSFEEKTPEIKKEDDLMPFPTELPKEEAWVKNENLPI